MNKEEKLTVSSAEQTVGVLQYAEDLELTEVRIPEGVEVIGAKAFSRCMQLRVLYLPSTLTHIDMKAFELCPLEDLYYAGTARQWAEVEISPQGSDPITMARKHFLHGDSVIERLVPEEDHKREILHKIRTLMEKGGDGRLHIVAPDLCVDGVLTKPGDLTLLIFPQGSTMMIDTGYFKNFSKVKEFLEGTGLSTLDYLVFSHADGDHVSNAISIATNLIEQKGGAIRHLWWTGQAYGKLVSGAEEYLRAHGTQIDLRVRAGRRFYIDGVQVEILGPTEEELKLDAADGEIRNSQSMIMKFVHGTAVYLTSGDLYAGQEAVVVGRCGRSLHANICKTNHHGCFTSNTDDWLDAVGAKIAFSCSNDNGSTALAREMKSRGTDYYSTGCHGTILISANAMGECEVTTQYDWGLRCLQRVN